jgi:DNA-binding beta-propeller fold protein YncE
MPTVFPSRPRLLVLLLLLAAVPPVAEAVPPGKVAEAVPPGKVAAEAAYHKGFALQSDLRTLEALEAYKEALLLNPFHGKAHYEIGWSYWVLRDWEQVVRHWEIALQLEGGTPELPDYLAMARERLEGRVAPLIRVAIGAGASSAGEHGSGGRPALSLRLAARFQHYDPRPDDPADRFDRHVFSPKSVVFAADGARAYVNALEGKTTLIYDPHTLQKLAVIPHRFDGTEPGLFDTETDARFFARFVGAGPPARPNRFEGKPVEAVFSHGGRFLWVSYYRRSYDRLGRLPSALAVVEAATGRIVRVLPTGPIPKTLAVSPDGRLIAAVHWGDNTVGLIAAQGDDPRAFRHAGEIVVEKRLALRMGEEVDRDHFCGFCLRGAVFTRDGRHLLVGRMGGGGIAVLDVAERRHVGTVHGMKPTPRHLLLSGDGETLYLSSSASGYVSMYRTDALVAAAREGHKRLAPLHQTPTGRGTRTIALAPGGRVLYAAVNYESKVVALDARDLHRLLEMAADSFPVGVAVSPDGGQLWVTSQGIKLRGGNSISVYPIGTGEDG